MNGRPLILALTLMILSLSLPSAFGAGAESPLYKLSAPSIEGATTKLSDFAGYVILIVNTASQCGYTPQYDGLEKLYAKYKDNKFVVLGFPSSDFGGQEPGTNSEIKKFCKVRFGVTFPLFAKSHVKGAEKNSVYQYLTAGPDASSSGDVSWNFEKFLISRKGTVIGRYPSAVTPDAKALTAAIERELADP